MPGYTHLQKAQPVTFGHVLMAYYEMFGRDAEAFSRVARFVRCSSTWQRSDRRSNLCT